MLLSKEAEQALENYFLLNKHSPKQQERLREMVAGELKGKGGYVLVLNKKRGGFFGINLEGKVIRI